MKDGKKSIDIDKNISNKFNKTLLMLVNNTQRQIVSRDFICSLIMQNIIRTTTTKEIKQKEIYKNITDTILNGNLDHIIANLEYSPIPYNIQKYSQTINRIELNIFLTDSENIFLMSFIQIKLE